MGEIAADTKFDDVRHTKLLFSFGGGSNSLKEGSLYKILKTLLEQATRSPMFPAVADFVRANPHIADRIDYSLCFANFELHEPACGSDALKLGNWVELVSDQEAEVSPPARSTNNRDEGLYVPDLAESGECSSNIRLAVVDTKQWPTIIYLNMMVQVAIGAQQFLETVDPLLRQERMPYFGPHMVKNEHYAVWINWAKSRGMTQELAANYAQGIRDFVFNGTMPNKNK